jgi:predicted AlkP superfamily pyrophosphatase or phosphodiesterase
LKINSRMNAYLTMTVRKILYILVWASTFLNFAPLQAQPKNCKHVILVGFDGFGAYSVKKASMPTLKMMMEKGAYSLTCRSVLPSSSAVNWASMLMASPPELHGYTEWGSQVPEIPSRVSGPGGIFPSVFGILEQQKPALKTAVVYNWDGIGYLFEKEMVDTVYNAGTDDKVQFIASRIIREIKPDFMFIYFDEPDAAGHEFGHDTPEYYKQLVMNDGRLSALLEAIRDAGIEKETLVIVASDHGGINKGHGGKTLQEMETPLVFFGAGIKNQPEINSGIMVYDIGATIAWLFRLDPPQVWTGRPVKQAFNKTSDQ